MSVLGLALRPADLGGRGPGFGVQVLALALEIVPGLIVRLRLGGRKGIRPAKMVEMVEVDTG